MIEDEIQPLNTGKVTVIAWKPLYDIYRDASGGLKTFSPIQYHKPCIPFPKVQKSKAKKGFKSSIITINKSTKKFQIPSSNISWCWSVYSEKLDKNKFHIS